MGRRKIPLIVQGHASMIADWWVEPGNLSYVEILVGDSSFRIEIRWMEVQSIVAEHVRRERIRALEDASEASLLGLEE